MLPDVTPCSYVQCIWNWRQQNSWTSFNITTSKVVQLHKIGAAISSISVSDTLFAYFLEPFPREWQFNTTGKLHVIVPAVAYKTNGRGFSTSVVETDTGLALLSVRVCALAVPWVRLLKSCL